MTDRDNDESAPWHEFSGELVRGEGGFALAGPHGAFHMLELPRVPVDLFGKMVIVTGELVDDGNRIIAMHIREQG